MGVSDAGIVMVSDGQDLLDADELYAWAAQLGVGLTLFHGWSNFVSQALFWSAQPKPTAAFRAVEAIDRRLKGVEASEEAVELWHTLVGAKAERIAKILPRRETLFD